jgi:hypothetical protein
MPAQSPAVVTGQNGHAPHATSLVVSTLTPMITKSRTSTTTRAPVLVISPARSTGPRHHKRGARGRSVDPPSAALRPRTLADRQGMKYNIYIC